MNLLLQQSNTVNVYAIAFTPDGRYTKYAKKLLITPRPKPDDYVYHEEEVLSYTKLSKRLDDIEANGVSQEKIEGAVSKYLDENPFDTGVNAEELKEAVDNALTEAKNSGLFDGKDGEPGKDGLPGYTPQKGIDYFDGTDGAPGEDGKDYVLTNEDKQEIAGIASGMIEVPESSNDAVHIGEDEPEDPDVSIWINPSKNNVSGGSSSGLSGTIDDTTPSTTTTYSSKKIDELLKAAGYVKNSKDIYTNPKTGDVCEYTFTIAGDTTDHPAYFSMKAAADILNANGFDIEVKTDINALKKLNNGDLTVWAAEWNTDVDPDMYQVYHKDSEATSTLNWGYRAILKNAGGRYDRELAIVEELSEIIDKARETLKEDERKAYYAEALDLVMDLAVELPTYQRSDLFAYNTNIIDESTLTPAADLTPFNGPMAKLWEVGLKESDGTGASSSTVVIIVIVAIVAVAGAGVGVFFVLKNKKAKAAAAKAPATTAPKATAEVKLEEEATTPEEENND